MPDPLPAEFPDIRLLNRLFFKKNIKNCVIIKAGALKMTIEDKIDDIVIPILRSLQSDAAILKTDIAVLKENTGRIDMRLRTVEAHMTGFMSSARYLETEIDQLRGRIEALEDTNAPEK